MLLTDGVIEGPSLSIDDGLDRVRRLVSAYAHADAEELADRVLQAAVFTGHEDDAAVLVLRHDATAQEPG